MNKEFAKDVLGVFNDCISHESCLGCPNCYCDWMKGDKCAPPTISHIPTYLCELVSRIIDDTIDLQHRCFEWISVEDRLPEKGGEYLLVMGPYYGIGYYTDGKWISENDGRFCENTHVTHWMPLPERPKEE